MKILLQLLVIHFLLLSVFAIKGVDLFAASSVSTFGCFKNNGNSFAIIRAFRSSGILDNNAAANLQNARTAGLETEIYMFPCRGKDPSTQVKTLFSGISSTLYSTVWIDVETNPSSGCSWKGHTAASNCEFLTTIINGILSQGKKAGVYSSRYQW